MTEAEHREILDAINRVDCSIPIKKYPASDWTEDKVREVLTLMNNRLKDDPSLYADTMWMDQWNHMQELAGYYGIDVS